jgi:hypothetical protein
MVGTLSFYDREGERQHTIYLAATPEYGKAKFLSPLESEIGRAKAKCPDAHYVGIADGAKENWEFLGRHTDVQVTDFWHAAEYLGKAAVVLYRGQPQGLRTSLGCLGAPEMSDSPLLSSPSGRISNGFCTIDPQENPISSGTSTP